jgi:hypothetical protein
MIFDMWELIPEKERLSNKKNIHQVCKILDRNDIDTSWSSLKSWAFKGNTLDPRKEIKQYSDQLGAKKELNDELAKSIKVMFSIWHW